MSDDHTAREDRMERKRRGLPRRASYVSVPDAILAGRRLVIRKRVLPPSPLAVRFAAPLTVYPTIAWTVDDAETYARVAPSSDGFTTREAAALWVESERLRLETGRC